jgi:hypothetical protein
LSKIYTYIITNILIIIKKYTQSNTYVHSSTSEKWATVYKDHYYKVPFSIFITQSNPWITHTCQQKPFLGPEGGLCKQIWLFIFILLFIIFLIFLFFYYNIFLIFLIFLSRNSRRCRGRRSTASRTCSSWSPSTDWRQMSVLIIRGSQSIVFIIIMFNIFIIIFE